METVGRFFQDPGTSYFLFGPRGTGKSTWLRERYPDALWVDLLAPEVHRRYSARPERLRELVAGNKDTPLVVIDEVQKAPGVLDVVHQLIETHRPRPRFILTGSSARKLRQSGVDLLAGRALLRHLHRRAAQASPLRRRQTTDGRRRRRPYAGRPDAAPDSTRATPRSGTPSPTPEPWGARLRGARV